MNRTSITFVTCDICMIAFRESLIVVSKGVKGGTFDICAECARVLSRYKSMKFNELVTIDEIVKALDLYINNQIIYGGTHG